MMLWIAWTGVVAYCCMLVTVWRRAGKQHITESDRRVLSLFANFSPPDSISAEEQPPPQERSNFNHSGRRNGAADQPTSKPEKSLARGAAGAP